jgi:uncharacterized protein (UPF0548 family)
MWTFARPSGERVAAFREAQRALAFTYPDPGCTRIDAAAPPAGYVRDHNRQLLGTGAATFARARDAIRDWVMFPPPLAHIEPHVPIAVGEVPGVLVHAFGVWFLNAARIVYVIDEPRRFAFAYGTLPGHAESGEERFLVEHLADDSVWFELVAFSRPRYWLARLAKPIARSMQRRFARMSKERMLKTVGGSATTTG